MTQRYEKDHVFTTSPGFYYAEALKISFKGRVSS